MVGGFGLTAGLVIAQRHERPIDFDVLRLEMSYDPIVQVLDGGDGFGRIRRGFHFQGMAGQIGGAG